MRVKAICEIPSARGVIPPGQIIDIPTEMVDRLKGKVQPLPFDAHHWRKVIGAMVLNLGRLDQPGVFPWVSEHRPELWQVHRDSMQGIGFAFQDQDAGKIETAIRMARQAFDNCLAAWSERHIHEQPVLALVAA